MGEGVCWFALQNHIRAGMRETGKRRLLKNSTNGNKEGHIAVAFFCFPVDPAEPYSYRNEGNRKAKAAENSTNGNKEGHIAVAFCFP